MSKNAKNKKSLVTSFSLLTGTTAILLPLASVVSCKDNTTTNGTDNNNPIDPSAPNKNHVVVNSEVLSNDFCGEEFGKKLFDLNVFKNKTLDEINIELIKSSLITPSDTTNIKNPRVFEIENINRELNSFTFSYEVELTKASINLPQRSYLTVYLPLKVEQKEELTFSLFSELAQKATIDQYLSSFKETFNNSKNSMFQNELYLDGIALWKSLIKQANAPYMYQMKNGCTYDLANNVLLSFTLWNNTTPGTSVYQEFDMRIKDVVTNKYEKITVANKTYLRITLGSNSIELQNKVTSESFTNTNTTTFYIDITNWNK